MSRSLSNRSRSALSSCSLPRTPAAEGTPRNRARPGPDSSPDFAPGTVRCPRRSPGSASSRSVRRASRRSADHSNIFTNNASMVPSTSAAAMAAGDIRNSSSRAWSRTCSHGPIRVSISSRRRRAWSSAVSVIEVRRPAHLASHRSGSGTVRVSAAASRTACPDDGCTGASERNRNTAVPSGSASPHRRASRISSGPDHEPGSIRVLAWAGKSGCPCASRTSKSMASSAPSTRKASASGYCPGVRISCRMAHAVWNPMPRAVSTPPTFPPSALSCLQDAGPH